MKLTMAQPKGTTHWKIELQMDLNVEELGVRTSDASLTLLTSNSFQLVPLSNNDFQVQSGKHGQKIQRNSFQQSEKNITIEYYFENRENIQSNVLGEIPRWRYPCVAKVTTCELKDTIEVSHAPIATLIGLTLGVLIGLLCCGACCGYCILKGSQAKRPNSVSTIEDHWSEEFTRYQVRVHLKFRSISKVHPIQVPAENRIARAGQELPYDIKTITPSPRRG